MTDVHVHYPLWFKVSVIVTLLFALAGPLVARRSAKPLLVCSLPAFGNLALTFFGLRELIEAMSTVGHGRLAAAAGSAEAQMMLVVGVAVTAVLAGVASLLDRRQNLARESLAIPAAAWLIGLVLLATELAIVWQLTQSGRGYSPALVKVANAGFWAALVLFSVLVAVVMRNFRALLPATSSSTPRFAITSVAFAVLALALWHIVRVLTEIAVGAYRSAA